MSKSRFLKQHYIFIFFYNRKLIFYGNILECLKSFIRNVMNMNGCTANYSFSIYCKKYFIGEEWEGEFSMFSNFEILLFLLPSLTSLDLFDKKKLQCSVGSRIS